MSRAERFRQWCSALGFVGFSFTSIDHRRNKDGVPKKYPRGMPRWKAVTRMDDTAVRDNHKAFAVRTGFLSGITVIDCDTPEGYHALIRDFPSLSKTLTIRTRHGYHIYCRYHPEVPTTTRTFAERYPAPIDTRNDDGLVFAPPTTYMDCISGELQSYVFENKVDREGLAAFPASLVPQTKSMVPLRRTGRSGLGSTACMKPCYQRSEKIPTASPEELDELLRLLPPEEYLAPFDTWYKIGAIVCFETEGSSDGLELFLAHSRRALRYAGVERKEVARMWTKYSRRRKAEQPEATVATLYWWCCGIGGQAAATAIRQKYRDGPLIECLF